MTANELLAELTRRGIRLEAVCDRLRVFPRSAVGPELLALLRQHKPALLAMLLAPKPAWQEPTARDLANARLALLAFHPEAPPGQPPTPTAGQCRCGCSNWLDVPVHGGESTRRDCGGCGRFRAFVRWRGKRFDN